MTSTRVRKAVVTSTSKTVPEGIEKVEVVDEQVQLDIGDHEVLIQVQACCINFPDLLQTAGLYQHKLPLPYTPGMEFAGDILALGRECGNRFQVGDRVMGAGISGGLSTHIVAHEAGLHRVPTPFSYDQAASFMVGATTAYHCLVERAKVQPGEWVLVNGATGGMGMAAVHICKALGAKVVATGGTNAKLAVVKAQGADHVINYNTTPKYRDEVKQVTGQDGVAVVFDPVGGDVFSESLRCTAWGARVLVLGFTSGVRPQAAMNYVLIKGLSLLGCRAGEYVRRHPEGYAAIQQPRLETLLGWAETGQLQPPHVSHRLPFTTEGVKECFRCLDQRQVVGRACVLTCHVQGGAKL
jgi:NADPH2:quinone reductase